MTRLWPLQRHPTTAASRSEAGRGDARPAAADHRAHGGHGIVVDDVGESIDAIGNVAEEMGGWLVSSSHAEEHFGFVSVRVPAEQLEDAIQRLRAMAQDVRSEITSSRDVTDEYYDIQARLTNLEATEGALIKLLDRAEKVEDALSIQQSLSEVQENIERLQGRIKLLEQTAAYSLINVSLELVKGKMGIDAGADKSTAVDEPVRFRATFTRRRTSRSSPSRGTSETALIRSPATVPPRPRTSRRE